MTEAYGHPLISSGGLRGGVEAQIELNRYAVAVEDGYRVIRFGAAGLGRQVAQAFVLGTCPRHEGDELITALRER